MSMKVSRGNIVVLASVSLLLLLIMAGSSKRVANPLSDNLVPSVQNFRFSGDSPVVSDREWLSFVENFEPFNTKYKDFCLDKLRETMPSGGGAFKRTTIGSQFQQDAYLIRNIFASHILSGKPGFYVDSGANHAETLSNTLFFDVCLGWTGICVEPNEIYHKELSERRSCVLVPECISKTTSEHHFLMHGGSGHVSEEATETSSLVTCRTLDEMLRIYAHGRTDIDLWSLDVEGYEMTILGSVPWGTLNFNAILIETFWLSDRMVDYFLTERGFAKVQQMAIDSLYVKLPQLAAWRPEFWQEAWEDHLLFRESMRSQGKLNPEY